MARPKKTETEITMQEPAELKIRMTSFEEVLGTASGSGATAAKDGLSGRRCKNDLDRVNYWISARLAFMKAEVE